MSLYAITCFTSGESQERGLLVYGNVARSCNASLIVLKRCLSMKIVLYHDLVNAISQGHDRDLFSEKPDFIYYSGNMYVCLIYLYGFFHNVGVSVGTVVNSEGIAQLNKLI
jgi:hypothetical protein